MSVHDWKVKKTLVERERLRISYVRRGRGAHLGRFGGGSNWQVGAEWGRRWAHIWLLVSYITVSWGPRPAHQRKYYKRRDRA